MNFAFNIVCKNELAKEKSVITEQLLKKTGILQKPQIELYWKDRTLSQITLNTVISQVDFNLIKDILSEISENEVFFSTSMEEWEFYHYASMDEIKNGKVFLVCNIF